MKIAVYALAKNEVKHAAEWAASCADADLRIVTDTGSTDGTVEALVQHGVTVCNGNVCPWRWDDAHNLSLNHVPSDVDVCIRLDLDERLQPGWRQLVEQAWSSNINQLRYHYVWSWQPDGSEGLTFHGDRIHARHGWRWAQATHEGLVPWACERSQLFVPGLSIHHHRDAGKSHKTDLFLLQVAVHESPHDARARWYLARQMDYAGMPEAAEEFRAYLQMPSGISTERAYARRTLARLTGDVQQLHLATVEAPGEPDAWMQLAYQELKARNWSKVVEFAEKAYAAPDPCTHATDPTAKTKALDLLAVSMWELGNRPEALTYARLAVGRCPNDVRLQRNVQFMEQVLE